MNRQQILNWLFPIQTDKQELETELISTKQFIFMVIVGISLMVVMELIING
jgi:hypothetical protein